MGFKSQVLLSMRSDNLSSFSNWVCSSLFTLQYLFEFVLLCIFQLCNSHISSILLLTPLLFSHFTFIVLFFSPTWVTNRVEHERCSPPFFISCHLFCSSLSYWPSARQEKERKGNACMDPSALRLLLISAFPTASLSVGSSFVSSLQQE